MYSRNRSPFPEEQYRSSLPPFYSGSRFQTVRREDAPPSPVKPPVSPVSPDPPPDLTADGKDIPSPIPEEENKAQDTEIRESDPSEKSVSTKELRIGGFSQEDLLLLALLLLLSAESERAMDVIVILLLLLGIR